MIRSVQLLLQHSLGLNLTWQSDAWFLFLDKLWKGQSVQTAGLLMQKAAAGPPKGWANNAWA